MVINQRLLQANLLRKRNAMSKNEVRRRTNMLQNLPSIINSNEFEKEEDAEFDPARVEDEKIADTMANQSYQESAKNSHRGNRAGIKVEDRA